MKPYIISIFLLFTFSNCQPQPTKETSSTTQIPTSDIEVIVLGTAQDGGSPHIGCKKSCCENLWTNPDPTRKVVSLGIIDHPNKKTYILDASPDFSSQLIALNTQANLPLERMPDGIFLTHAHIGHYTGLMYLGREAKGAKGVPVFGMPKMNEFLASNGPWSQLVTLENIKLNELQNETKTILSNNLSITPFLVPHRDEYSETVGFKIETNKKKFLFIPDIDKWSKWEKDIITEIKNVDVAFLDATFYDAAEVNHRAISEIPHPFAIESMQLFSTLPNNQKEKIHFIHLNHTNPLLNPTSKQSQEVKTQGFNTAHYLQSF